MNPPYLLSHIHRALLSPFPIFARSLTTSTLHLPTLTTPADHQAAQEWIDEFKAAGVRGIPKDGYEIDMTRSSGPGGQNVNKLSTKAMLRCFLTATEGKSQSKWIPNFLLPALRDTAYYTSSPPSLLLSSSLTRSAALNREDALKKLHTLIVDTSQTLVVKPTSAEQKARVQGLVRREEARRKVEKARRGDKKSSRRSGGWD